MINEAIERLWEKAEPVVFITRGQFMRNLSEWEVETHHGDAFLTIRRGPEFHVESLGTGRNLGRRTTVDFLRKIIDEHGYAMTRTPHDDERQHRFNRALGFVEVGRDQYDVIYRIERIRGCRS